MDQFNGRGSINRFVTREFQGRHRKSVSRNLLSSVNIDEPVAFACA